MKKYRILTALAGLAFCIGMKAQVKAVRVESPIVTEKDSSWYVEQKDAWRNIAQREPRNEAAWLNYYNAARYTGWFGEPSDSLVRRAMKEMREAIPNTYIYNMCAYMSVKLGFSDETDGDPYAEAALTMLPDEMQLNDYNEWVCYLAMKGQEQRMTQMAKRYSTADSTLKPCCATVTTNWPAWTRGASTWAVAMRPSYPNGSFRREWACTRTRPSSACRSLP